MSFSFRWPRFSDKFHTETMQMLDAALNKGSKPPIIEDRIEVVELEMGTEPPELEIRDIGDLTTDQFRGIFKLSYAGDAHIVLRTKVQANPLHHKKPGMDLLGSSRGVLAAHQPLIVPMLLRLSNFKLSAYVVLVVSKQKGITLVFKTDPLQNVDVSSTFDSIAVIQKYIQREIEGQLRDMFRDDLPNIIHRLSQRWIPGNTKIETPYATLKPHRPQKPVVDALETMSVPGNSPLRWFSAQRSSSMGYLSPSSLISLPTIEQRSVSPATESEVSSFPDLEHYDPTYGMRHNSLFVSGSGIGSTYATYGRLLGIGTSRGLADLTEESHRTSIDDVDDYRTERSFDMLRGWNNEPHFDDPAEEDLRHAPDVEYESVPAIGGGTITRPRILHSQSIGLAGGLTTRPLVPSRTASGYFTASHAAQASPLRRQWSIQGGDQLQLGASARTYRANSSVHSVAPSAPYRNPLVQATRESVSTSWDSQSYSPSGSDGDALGILSTPPSSAQHHRPHNMDDGYTGENGRWDRHLPRRRKGSISHSLVHPFSSSTSDYAFAHPSSDDGAESHEGLDPLHNISHSLNNTPSRALRPGSHTTAHLATLSHAHHTLSPFTREMEHYTVRSGLHGPQGHRFQQQGEEQQVPRAPVKARRKRTHYIGAARKTTAISPTARKDDVASQAENGGEYGEDDEGANSRSLSVPSEFSDVDHYFAANMEIAGTDAGLGRQ